MDFCINGLMACLMYQTADRPMGTKKTKQQARRNELKTDRECPKCYGYRSGPQKAWG